MCEVTGLRQSKLKSRCLPFFRTGGGALFAAALPGFSCTSIFVIFRSGVKWGWSDGVPSFAVFHTGTAFPPFVPPSIQALFCPHRRFLFLNHFPTTRALTVEFFVVFIPMIVGFKRNIGFSLVKHRCFLKLVTGMRLRSIVGYLTI
jgi:hypothetical protein